MRKRRLTQSFKVVTALERGHNPALGVTAGDLTTYAIVAPLLGLAALLACWWPARRATAVDVLDVLRAE